LKKDENLRELSYWENVWQHSGMDFGACEEFWNNRASSFNQSLKEKEKKTNQLINYLTARNILNNKAKVLDIGCGPGTHSIPMAQTAEEVISLDISVNMLNIIREKTQELNYSNVVPMKENWGEVNLGDKKWNKHFDLVFASMSPGVHNYETLKKMCDASKNYCYLSAWVKRESKVEDALFQLVNKNEGATGILDDKIYYAFNILWNMGYCPEISYNRRDWSSVQPFEEALENYTKKLMIKNNLDEHDKLKIKNYLHEISDKGMITEESKAITGTIIWQV
jgi:SAM-dependent methyltransferase